MLAPDGRSDPASRNAGHDRVRRAWPRPCGRTTLLFTRNMGKYFRISIGLSLYDDVLISFLIDRLLASLQSRTSGILKAPFKLWFSERRLNINYPASAPGIRPECCNRTAG